MTPIVPYEQVRSPATSGKGPYLRCGPACGNIEEPVLKTVPSGRTTSRSTIESKCRVVRLPVPLARLPPRAVAPPGAVVMCMR